MEFTRWYDSDEKLKLFMHTMEKLDDEIKLSIATDIIQMIIESQACSTDNLLDGLDLNYIPIRRRWYDKSETLHSAIEMIKLIDNDKRNEILNEIFYSVFYFTECDNLNNFNKEEN